MRLVPVGVDPELFKPLAGRRPRARPADHHRLGRRGAEGARLPARGDGQAAHRARRHADDHRQAEARQEHGPHRASSGCGRTSSSCPASPTSGSSSCTPRPSWPSCRASTRVSACPAIEAMCYRHAARRHRRRRAARGHRHRRRHRAPVPRPATPTRSRRRSAAASTTPSCAPRVGAAGRRRVVERWTWRRCAELTVDQYREVLAMPQNVAKLRRNGRRPDADDPLRPPRPTRPARRATLVLDVGAGFGRHAFECARRGDRVVALDYAADEVDATTRRPSAAMVEAGEIAADRFIGVLRGDATALAVRRRLVRRRHHVGGARAHPGRRRRRSPRWPAC